MKVSVVVIPLAAVITTVYVSGLPSARWVENGGRGEGGG